MWPRDSALQVYRSSRDANDVGKMQLEEFQLASHSFSDVSIPHIEANLRTLLQIDPKQAGGCEGVTRARNEPATRGGGRESKNRDDDEKDKRLRCCYC
jgi:hypothetical protein